jgi:Glycosyl hydrolases family 28
MVQNRCGPYNRLRDEMKTVIIIPLLGFWVLWALPALGAEGIEVVADPTGKAVQAAIDACAARGGGVAYLPPGRYITGPLWLKDNVELRLEAGATVVFSTDKKDWSAGVRALINAKGAKHIAVTGRGAFDGNAQWEYAPVRGQDPEISEEQEIARRAGVEMKRYYRTGAVQKYLFVLQDSEDVRLEGVTIQNAPLWNVRLQDCSRVWIRDIHLYSDLEKGVNSDGIDIVSSSDVLIADSIISTADDAICLKTVDLGERGRGTIRPTENIVVNNCILTSSSTAMMIGTETHADIRHVLFSNIIVRNSNKVFGINVQDGVTVSDVRFANITFETNRRHWNWWGSAEVMKFVLKKRTPESRLGCIRDITIDGAQGTARGSSLVAGHAERRLQNIAAVNLRVKMLAENKPDKRATHALVFQGIDGLTLRGVEVDWDRETPEPKWGSALVLRDISNLVLEDFHGVAARQEGQLPAILKENVTDRHGP